MEKKKRQNSDKKMTKIIEKTIEKESEKEAQQIVDIKTIANDLALNLIKANSQLESYLIRSKTRAKTIKNDPNGNPVEVIQENEKITVQDGIIDRKGLKELTSALKDLNDVLANRHEENNDDKTINVSITNNSLLESINRQLGGGNNE